MERGFPSKPLRMIFGWVESCEGLGPGMKRKRGTRMTKRMVSIFFIRVYRYGISIGWMEGCGKNLFMGNDSDNQSGYSRVED
jgi:hypothetical protein